MKYLVVILIIVLLFLILKNDLSEKFNQDLVSPEVIEIIKTGQIAMLKFKNDSKQKRKFMIFYIDTELPESGIWVEKKIECEEEICSVELSELTGNRYHLAIVETDGKNMSSIGKIVKFGNGQPYTPYEIIPTISDIVSVEDPQKPMLNSEVEPNQESFIKEDEEESDSPSPYVICGRNPLVKYVDDKTDMDDIEVRTTCNEDIQIPKIRKIVSRSLWDEFKKGNLTVDLNLVNE